MGIKKYRPLTPGQRFRSSVSNDDITETEPERKLLRPRKRLSARNMYGRITVRRRGGGHKRQYRVIDFRRDKLEVPGRVHSVQYDPNRSARIALVHYVDGEKRYILCPNGLGVGDPIIAGERVEPKVGNAMPIKSIPVGEMLHNVELRPGAGGALVRGAGTGAQLMAKAGKYALLRLPSGEQRKILLTCMATVGVVGNSDHANKSLGKAGVSRWLGRRPKVRGVAMNPVDHPHGGGEGRTSGGRHPVTPWGVSTKGYKTRHNPRTDKFIVRRGK